MDFPGKRLILVCHCILNQNAVLRGWERARGAFPFAADLMKSGYGVIQLPCPELLFLGPDRPPMSYEDYARLSGYREHCIRFLEPVLKELSICSRKGYRFRGVIAVQESPNCALSERRGVFMELLFEQLHKLHLSTDFIELPVWYAEGEERDFRKRLDGFLRGKRDES